ncbi:MAG: PadR family transcriptional regulator [Clostridia bacterium]|nr:PadR family transcriptional regulator [Clostridia bacterium]
MQNTDNFKRGTVELIVLSVLTQKDMYGYELVKTISEKSEKNFELPLGTLYPVLYRFVENGLISDRDEVVNKRLRKYYHLEEKGKQYYQKLLDEYKKVSLGVNLILKAVNEND